ncbi:geranylgeranyl transferase type-1 subunit beta [Tieghemiomyces parasiticus]|uniref:Geranylgeranyl transferase type-1 subunit beta n=1 Tax=Tieghemiomyces parasiticus TaxID=78921 RepID=A0A9W8DT47_9FUNG|nr:geranylgeranyl transferase type-1 subunit beta [Tieghemiomyces parasiticus]
MQSPPTNEFLTRKHVAYFQRCLSLLPHSYQCLDSTRLTLGMFCFSGLDLLGTLTTALSQDERRGYIDWIYAQQVTAAAATKICSPPTLVRFLLRAYPAPLRITLIHTLVTDVPGSHGFCGGPFSGPMTSEDKARNYYTVANLAATYSALVSLVGRIVRKHLFTPHPYSIECDLRFVYCACAVCHLLDDWSGVDKAKAVGFIRACQQYDGGFATAPGNESHGGVLVSAVASLKLMGHLDDDTAFDRSAAVAWGLRQQDRGFHGRVNKEDDTCYSYWIGAGLKVMGAYDLVNLERQRAFLLATQRHIGGFGKAPSDYPDTLHSYMGLTAFSMMGEPGLKELIPELNISMDAYQAFRARQSSALCRSSPI